MTITPQQKLWGARLFAYGMCLYFALSALGRHHSYWDFLGSLVLFAVIYLIGYNNRILEEKAGIK